MTTRGSASAALGLLVLTGCGASTSAGPPTTFATPTRLRVASGIPRAYAPEILGFTIRNGVVSGRTGPVPVVLNSRVRLSVVADVVAEVRVQGLDASRRTAVGQPVQLDFIASRAGDLQVRLSHPDLLLTTLHVA